MSHLEHLVDSEADHVHPDNALVVADADDLGARLRRHRPVALDEEFARVEHVDPCRLMDGHLPRVTCHVSRTEKRGGASARDGEAGMWRGSRGSVMGFLGPARHNQ